MGKQGVQQGAELTSLGAPVLSIRVVEVTLPIRTTCGLPDRKSRIQLDKEALMRRSRSFMTSLDGIMVLKAEL